MARNHMMGNADTQILSTNLYYSTPRAWTPVPPAEWCPRLCWGCLFLDLHRKIHHLTCWFSKHLVCMSFLSQQHHTEYLSDEFFLFGRLWHAADLLVKLSEGWFSVILSIRCDCCYGGRRGGHCHCSHRALFGPRTESQVILKKCQNKPNNIQKSVFIEQNQSNSFWEITAKIYLLL